jgi:hypothetical protein
MSAMSFSKYAWLDNLFSMRIGSDIGAGGDRRSSASGSMDCETLQNHSAGIETIFLL